MARIDLPEVTIAALPPKLQDVERAGALINVYLGRHDRRVARAEPRPVTAIRGPHGLRGCSVWPDNGPPLSTRRRRTAQRRPGDRHGRSTPHGEN
ncbi:MAG: hypothetical protein QOH56_1995 [Pseudonocardiales bacterium]|jgi:hypothetical protein|nr:hypothetical protein [Pseudonocardiales bacterium]